MKIYLPKLFLWQQDVWDKFNPKGQRIVIKAPRQTGKSRLLGLLLLKTAGELRGSASIVVEPTLAQARKMFNDIGKMFRDTGLIEKLNESLLVIKFTNGSEILFKSAEQGDSIRGFTVSGILVLDEAAYIDTNFIEDLLPVIRFHNASLIATSTPLFEDGWFYENFISSNNITFDWSKYDLSEVLTPEQVDYYKHTYSKNKFTTEILGEFLVNDGKVFRNIEECIEDYSCNGNLYFGIDWGSGQGKDYTAISCLDDEGKMKFIKYFNDKSPKEQIDIITSLINTYKPVKITVESNSIGAVYYDMLTKAVSKKIIKFNTDNKSKNRIIDKLNNALEEKKIKILRDKELLIELKMYQQERTKSGLITYNASRGFNDDLIIATAICYDSIFSNSGSYNISYV